MSLPARAVIRARIDLSVDHNEDGSWRSGVYGYFVDILVPSCLHHLPSLPAVAAMARAVYRNARPDIVRLHRIDGDSGKPRRADRFALRRDFHRPLLPGPTTILRTKEHRRRRRACSHIHVVRIHRIDTDGPDIVGIECRVDVLPVRSAIFAAIEPSLGAGKEVGGSFWIHCYATHGSFVGKPAPRPDARPCLSVVFAPHYTLPDSANDDRHVFHSSLLDLIGFKLFERLERLERLELERFPYTPITIRVPTLLGTKAFGNSRAIKWVARQPVQCSGTMISGLNSF